LALHINRSEVIGWRAGTSGTLKKEQELCPDIKKPPFGGYPMFTVIGEP
jgi:hypothetical protein